MIVSVPSINPLGQPSTLNEKYFLQFMEQEKITFDKDLGVFFRTRKHKKILDQPQIFCTNGSATEYQRLVFFYKGQTRTCMSHRIAWQLVNGDIPKGLQVDHINGVKNDNRICNLQLLSPSENIRKMHKERNKY